MIKNHFPALTNRNFLIFYIGQFISLIGSLMQMTVQPYLAYRLTEQPILLGVVGFAATLPGLLFIMPAGVIIERANKKRIIIIMKFFMTFQAFTLAYLTLTNQITVWHIIVLAFLLGTANSFEFTARQAMYVDLVGKELIPNAIALNSTAFNAARVIGPSLTAPFLLISSNGEGYAFLANGIGYLIAIISLFFVQYSPGNLEPLRQTMKSSEILAGPKYILQTPVIIGLVSMIAITGFFGYPFIQFVPVIARDLLLTVGDSANVVATRNSILISSMGVGALVTAFLLSLNRTTKRNSFILRMGQVMLIIGFAGLSMARSMFVAIPMMIAYGIGFVTQMTITNTMIQLMVPDAIRGRVISVYIWVNQSSAPFGSLFIGWMIQNLGPSQSLMITAIICAVGFFMLHRINPSVRSIGTIQ